MQWRGREGERYVKVRKTLPEKSEYVCILLREKEEQDIMGRGRQTDDESREKVCVRLHLSVCLRTRGKEQDRVRESASQRGRERQREGK